MAPLKRDRSRGNPESLNMWLTCRLLTVHFGVHDVPAVVGILSGLDGGARLLHVFTRICRILGYAG